MTVRAVHHLNCASMCPIGGRLLSKDTPSWRGKMVAHCLLIETERDGLVVVDTGFGTRDIDGHTRISRSFKFMCGPAFDHAETAVAQVAARGYSPDDVRHIVVTHLDLDHAGGLADFPKAKVHLHSREHAAAMTRATFVERERYLPAQWHHGPAWQVYTEDGDTWRGLPAITRLRGLDADIGLLPMHGHTRGHSAVIVNAGDRWLVHAGDAYYHRAAVEGAPLPVGIRLFAATTTIDAAAYGASVAALRQLRDSYDDVDVFCAHDPHEYERQVARSSVRPTVVAS